MAQVFIGEFYWLSGIFRNDIGLNNGATNQKIAATFEIVSVEKVIRLNLCSLLPFLVAINIGRLIIPFLYIIFIITIFISSELLPPASTEGDTVIVFSRTLMIKFMLSIYRRL